MGFVLLPVVRAEFGFFSTNATRITFYKNTQIKTRSAFVTSSETSIISNQNGSQREIETLKRSLESSGNTANIQGKNNES
jgi:hypothetical protein